jgi:fucose permease
VATRTLVFAGLFVDALVVLVVAGSLPAFATSFGVRQDVAGLVFTTNGLGFVAAVPLSGLLGDRFGKRAVAAVSAAVVAVGLAAFAASHNLASGLGAAVLIGAGGGAVESGITALLPDLYPGREGFANNFAQSFFGLGATLGPPLLLAAALGWRLRFLLGAAAYLVVAVGMWRERGLDAPAAAAPEVHAASRSLAASLRSAGVIAPALGLILYTGVEVALWGWLFAVVTRPGGAGPVWAVAELSGFWCAMGLGRLGSGILADRVPLPALIAAGTAAGIPALLLALLLPSPAGALAAAIVCGLAFSGIWPSLVALAQRDHGGSNLLAALLVAAGGIGALIVPAAFGFATARLGLATAAVGLAVLLVPVSALALVPARRARPA